MPEEFDNEFDDNPEPSGAARRVQERDDAEKTALRQENAILKAGLPDLSDEQRTALLAVVGADLSTDAVKAKAEALGFLKAAQADGEPDPATKETVDAEQRISAVASESSSQQTHAQVAGSWRDRLTAAPLAHMQPGGALYQQVLAEIQASPNLSIGSLDHDGSFQPT